MQYIINGRINLFSTIKEIVLNANQDDEIIVANKIFADHAEFVARTRPNFSIKVTIDKKLCEFTERERLVNLAFNKVKYEKM